MNRAQNSVAMKKVDKIGFITSVGKIPINKVKINWKKVLSAHATLKFVFLNL